MLKGIKELLEIVFLWGFLYLGAIFILVLGIVHIKSNQPIKQHHTYNAVQVLQPPKRVVEREVCNKIAGCQVVNGTCPTCVMEKVWE